MNIVCELLQRKGRTALTLSQDSTLHQCAQVMANENIGSVLITEEGELAGIVTWHDVVQAFATDPSGAGQVEAASVMATKLETTDEQSALSDVRKRMLEKQIRHMPVLKGDTVVGIITLIDVLALRLDEAKAMSEQLAAYIYGTVPS